MLKLLVAARHTAEQTDSEPENILQLQSKGLFYIWQDGTWAGQQELVALSRSAGYKIAIFQAGQPCWTLNPSTLPQARSISACGVDYSERCLKM